MQLSHDVIIFNSSLNQNRIVVQPFETQAVRLGRQVLQARLFPTGQSPGVHLVVQSGRTPEVILNITFQKFLAFEDKRADSPRFLIESHREILIIDRGITRIKPHLLFFRHRLQGCRRPIQPELVVGHLRTGRHKGLVFLGLNRETDEKLLAGIAVDAQTLNINLLRFKGLHVQVDFILSQGFLSREDFNIAIEGRGVGEREPVFGLKLAPSQVLGGKLDGLIHLLHLGGVMMRPPVAADHAVGAESVVVAHPVGMAEVAANGKPIHILVFIVDDKALVHPVPDAAALQLPVGFNHVPIVLQSAHAVAHRVAVFHHDERPMIYAIKTFIHKALQVFRAGIHQADDIGIAVVDGSLVGHRAGFVAVFHPVVGVFKVDAVAALVAHRPHDDRGMVLVAFKHVAAALPYHLLVFRVFGKALFAIALGMRLAVGLVPNVESITVAEFIPIGVVGIMAGAYRIDVHLLHQGDVALHRLAADDVARVGVMLVAVHTFY